MNEGAGNLLVLEEFGYVPHPDDLMTAVKFAFDGRIIASISIPSINSYPETFLRALLKQKEEEGRFEIIEVKETL